ncbi:MAG: hypothetical protein NTW96_27515 [Planctomycetia bacterium]|nr:hypothetical protein [Planctomycetia bacterium]
MPKASGPTKVELPFPFKGVSGDSAFGRVPEGMSPDALNVMGFDALGGRLRGGQRPGLSKYWTTALNGGLPVQSLIQGTSAVSPGSVAGATLSDPFTLAAGYFWDKSPTDWDHFLGSPGGVAAAWFAGGRITANANSFVTTGTALTSQYPAGTYKVMSAFYLPGRYYSLPSQSDLSLTLKMVEPPLGAASTTTAIVYYYFRVDPTMTGACYGVRLNITVYSSNHATQANKATLTATAFKSTTAGTSDIATFHTTTTSAALKTALMAGTVMVCSTYGTGTSYATVGITNAALTAGGGASPNRFSDATYLGWSKVGFGVQAASATATDQVTVEAFSISGVDYGLGVASNKTILAGVAGGSVYVADAGTYTPTLATGGSSILSTSRQWIGAALNHGAPGDAGALPGHQMIYYVDGLVYKRLDLATSTVIAWAATAGTLPIDSANNTATMIATYRNRIVLSGLVADPQNWFMAAVNDPLNWDYAPATTSATMAVAGNNSNAGIVGDVVTCLAPYSDDVMVMGGDHTLWVMRGDPAARGQIDNVSRKTGIVGPRAFAWDDRGNIHFFGSGRHWIMSAGSNAPVAQSAGRMDREWGALDLSGTSTGVGIQLVWDVLRRGLHIYASPNDTGVIAKHWFWDSRTDAYWPIQYPLAMNPRSVLGFDATKVDDTALLVAGNDGYVRYFDPAVKNDDGTAIDSWVVFRPVSNGSTDLRVTHADIVLDDNTDFATFQVFSAETPQTATALGSLRFAKVLGPGRTHVIGRASDNTLAIRLRNNTISQTWAYESGELQLSPAGHTMPGARST